MPYPAQINPERILSKAREMVEAESAEQLSLHKLAAALGVKAPSLYRYIPGKTELLRALNLQTVQLLTTTMQATAGDGDAGRQLLSMAKAWRAFAQEYPMTYTLAFANTNPELRPDERLMEAQAIPVQQLIAAISGEQVSLTALRGLWALVHGFVLLELSGQFRRGGDLEAAFTGSIEAYLNGCRQVAN